MDGKVDEAKEFFYFMGLCVIRVNIMPLKALTLSPNSYADEYLREVLNIGHVEVSICTGAGIGLPRDYFVVFKRVSDGPMLKCEQINDVIEMLSNVGHDLSSIYPEIAGAISSIYNFYGTHRKGCVYVATPKSDKLKRVKIGYTSKGVYDRIPAGKKERSFNGYCRDDLDLELMVLPLSMRVQSLEKKLHLKFSYLNMNHGKRGSREWFHMNGDDVLRMCFSDSVFSLNFQSHTVNDDPAGSLLAPDLNALMSDQELISSYNSKLCEVAVGNRKHVISQSYAQVVRDVKSGDVYYLDHRLPQCFQQMMRKSSLDPRELVLCVDKLISEDDLAAGHCSDGIFKYDCWSRQSISHDISLADGEFVILSLDTGDILGEISQSFLDELSILDEDTLGGIYGCSPWVSLSGDFLHAKLIAHIGYDDILERTPAGDWLHIGSYMRAAPLARYFNQPRLYG